jgi:hypothetical protein
MPASISRPLHQQQKFGRLWWLPSDGEGNGIDDTAWTPLATAPADVVRALLAELRAAGVPAYAAPVTSRPTRPGARAAASRYHLWVGTSRYGRAEEVLLARLPALLGWNRP